MAKQAEHLAQQALDMPETQEELENFTLSGEFGVCKIRHRLCTLLARARTILGNCASAIELLRNVLKTSPNPQTYNTLGKALRDNGQFDEAISMHQCALDLNPSCVEAHYSKGIAYALSGDNDAAILSYLAVTEMYASPSGYHLEPHQPWISEAYTNLGACYSSKGNEKRAASSWKKALEFNPRHPSALLNLAVIEPDPDERIRLLLFKQRERE
jgi:Flp pilus assembly protein TadD